MAKRAPDATLAGVDVSTASVEATRQRNRRAIEAGRMEVKEGSVEALPWPDESFDLVTACETIYFWGDLAKAFREVARVLKPGGTFAVIIEAADPEGARIWTDVVPGMRVRTVEELSSLLVATGFAPPAVHRKSSSANAWTCIVAQKPANH
jgi:ubiquinone/menaquinone biosynthesis C-methylase UbiE